MGFLCVFWKGLVDFLVWVVYVYFWGEDEWCIDFSIKNTVDILFFFFLSSWTGCFTVSFTPPKKRHLTRLEKNTSPKNPPKISKSLWWILRTPGEKNSWRVVQGFLQSGPRIQLEVGLKISIYRGEITPVLHLPGRFKMSLNFCSRKMCSFRHNPFVMSPTGCPLLNVQTARNLHCCHVGTSKNVEGWYQRLPNAGTLTWNHLKSGKISSESSPSIYITPQLPRLFQKKHRLEEIKKKTTHPKYTTMMQNPTLFRWMDF